MDIARLRQMVEQIASNFAARGPEKAAAATADHLATFWDPRMKEAIIEDDPAVLSPIARTAIDLLATGSFAGRQTRATDFNGRNQTELSDAG